LIIHIYYGIIYIEKKQKELILMKCELCYKKTDWDSSIGRPNFIVCNSCVEKFSKGLAAMVQMYNTNDNIGALCLTSAIILDIGLTRENNKN
jgi:hypothetical protein